MVLPAEAIVKETDKQDANLVIMGSRGLGGLQGFILDSVSRSVCNNVGCPVLVVKLAQKIIRALRGLPLFFFVVLVFGLKIIFDKAFG